MAPSFRGLNIFIPAPGAPLSRQVYGTEVLGEGSPTLEGNRLLPSRGRLSQRAWRAGGGAVAPPLCWRLRCLGLPLSQEACAADPRHPPPASAMNLGKLSGCCRLSVEGAREHVRGALVSRSPEGRKREQRSLRSKLPSVFKPEGLGEALTDRVAASESENCGSQSRWATFELQGVGRCFIFRSLGLSSVRGARGGFLTAEWLDTK